MQKTAARDGRTTAVDYRERLSPSLWAIVSAAVCAPMAALVFAPLDATVSLTVGVVVGVLIILVMVAASPVVRVKDGVLFAGRAHIDVALLGTPRALTGEEARHARGGGLPAHAWHVIRGGIDGILTIDVEDADDPAPTWVISSRTPDRLAAAVRRAQATRRTPGR
ncbi:DUF3093 domain-containing protein [Microbacterium terricola]|uniref:DUF3093 domain-containing protein n=1 Tax=Microbacterium terricola TaxID=344163 RepID=A0ABM8DY85_9MICO|nr:DUF3093 domain-containing protein [Microbacterium terricola]UYK38664.1 DUF3093 domain-containing protein [Microbacterium terricola]BDV30648.1 hypothetical protein Microterr_13080 [Microbacterium terricola]